MKRVSRTGRAGYLACFVLGVCLPAGAALAGADCSITASSVNFGTYDPLLTQPDDTAGTVTVTCTHVPPGATTVAYTVSVSNGLNGTNATARQMASGTSRLGYNVFNDAGRSQVLGNGIGGTVLAQGSMKVGPGAGNTTRTVTHTFHGRVPAALDPAPGAYADTLVLTLTY